MLWRITLRNVPWQRHKHQGFESCQEVLNINFSNHQWISLQLSLVVMEDILYYLRIRIPNKDWCKRTISWICKHEKWGTSVQFYDLNTWNSIARLKTLAVLLLCGSYDIFPTLLLVSFSPTRLAWQCHRSLTDKHQSNTTLTSFSRYSKLLIVDNEVAIECNIYILTYIKTPINKFLK